MRRAITYAGAVLLKRSLFVVIGIVLVSGGLITAKSLLGTLPTTYAVTPPDSCFSFSGGQILNYYANEGNNPANPACPKAVDIPATLGGTPVTQINIMAFASKSLTSVTIPNSVITIGSSAFRDNQLTSVTLPSGLTTIADQAFQNNFLTSITLPSTLTTIGNFAFHNNTISSINLPNSLTSIGIGAFGRNSLTSVTIPDSITTINEAAFSYNQITSVVLPSALTSIGDSAFISNAIETITLPSSLTTIGHSAFMQNKLSSVAIPESVTSIGTYAFSTNQLTSLAFPSSLTTISDSIASWNYLSSVTIPDTVTSIGSSAFADNNLTSVTLGNSVTSILDCAFCVNKLASVTLPASVTSITPSAFIMQTPWGRAIEDSSDPAHDLWGGNQEAVSAVYANFWLVQLYAASGSSLQNSLIPEDWYMGEDLNNDGTTLNVIGGHIINPANVEARYRTADGVDVAPSAMLLGKKTDGSPLGNYLAAAFTSPAFVNATSPTPSEQQAIDDTLAVFYRKGQAVSLTAPTVAGYQLVSPGSPANVTLVSAANVFTFTYAAVVPNQPPAAQPAPAKRPAVAAPSTASSPSTGTSSQATQPRSQVVFASPVGSANGPNDTPPTDLGELFTNSTLSTDQTQSCHDITTASLLSPTTFDTPDTTATTLGGVTLTVGCQDEGGKGSVSLTFGDTLDNLDDVRVYQPITGGRAIDVTRQVSFSTTTVDGKPKTVLSYPLHDGASFDTDGSANRSIASKLYLVRLAKAVMSPHTTSSPSHNDETPWLRYALIASGAIVLLAAATTAMIIRQRRS